MAETVRTVTEIDAPPEQLWAVLTAFDRYHLWNPRVGRVVVRTESSTRMSLQLKRPGSSRPMRLVGSILEMSRPQLIKWSGGHRVWGLVGVTHTLVLVPLSGGRTRLEQTAKVRGMLSRRAVAAAKGLMAETGEAAGRAACDAAGSRTGGAA